MFAIFVAITIPKSSGAPAHITGHIILRIKTTASILTTIVAVYTFSPTIMAFLPKHLAAFATRATFVGYAG